tara:strand:+ start:187 stop:1515 length:1329 start_codon:yes stop_codon:yes gene_type:complete
MTNNIDINKLLDREILCEQIINSLSEFDTNKNSLTIKRGFYIYGNPGSGKSSLITNILKNLNYDIINYNASDVRNKSIIENITKHNMAENNVMALFKRNNKKIVIIMDEIDGMNSGDKGGINSLIKIIRPKKTKKQKSEDYTYNPIICIGNYHIDKKIKELMKVCHTFEVKSPTNEQIKKIIQIKMPSLTDDTSDNITLFCQNDMRKLFNLCNLYEKNNNIFNSPKIFQSLQTKSYIDDIKNTIVTLFNNLCDISCHNKIISETDRTIIALLWHENIVDILSKKNNNFSIPLYLKFLDNICFADYIDRITFQKQIWQFNEMTSLIKTFKNNFILHNNFPKIKFKPKEPDGVRFTKVLTKYSTEFNNSVFISNLSQQLMMDKNDIYSFFYDLQKNNISESDILTLFENLEISKLDINRIFRYLSIFTNSDFDIESDEDDTDYN